jgi:hypothetical protein
MALAGAVGAVGALGSWRFNTASGIKPGMSFMLRTDSIEDLDDWLDAEAEARHTSKQAITIAAPEEYRQQRELTHVLALGAKTAARHRSVLDRLADA